MVRKLKNLVHLARAVLSVVFYRYPAGNLCVIGVTGTDGKTTTVHLIGAILSQAGFKTATLSTLGAYLGDKKISTGFHVTTPDPWVIQKILRNIADRGFTHVVLEATSHGLDQHRLLGCNFQVGVLTNITQEHLDYHKTYQNYIQAKMKLFRKVKLAVLNRDDSSFKQALEICRSRRVKIKSYGVKEADLTPKSFPFKTKLPGEHNVYNCLAAISVGKYFNIKDGQIRKAVEDFPGLAGRLEEINEGQSFKVFVDFAHTPAAFSSVLPTAKKMIKGEVIHVFGCTGDRDKSKRAVMGEISGRLADRIILTHEDNYFEEPEKIIAQIKTGVEKAGKVLGKNYWTILDRRLAIKMAIEMASKNDAVLLTGVGHQTTLNLKGVEVPWSDKEIARDVIREKLK
ncbi:MAG: UDP-N-acetylmuramoyl-L-alanyl-D-glutamate--2,6-diaminopimelate ligase [bacterium]|nr:UDP-N-acetylmuramoyl-L-alanyl-D-glutamate--2,6-diaminopimelate ligase [bacterium]